MSANGKNTKPDYSTLLIYAAAYLVAVFLLLRFNPAVAIGMLVGGLLGALVYYLYFFATKGRKQKKGNGFSDRVMRRLEECKANEERFRAEAEQIMASIKTLRDDVERSAAAGDDEKARAEQLIKDFEAEFNLRHAKASFFADCRTKLKELLDRHRLHESITARRKELEHLRQTNFDDEATLEETRYHLEQDSIQLDTIAELSKDVSVSFKAEQAEELRARLEKLRTSL